MVMHSSLERKAQSSMPSAAAARACTYSIYVKKFLVFGIIFMFVLFLKKKNCKIAHQGNSSSNIEKVFIHAVPHPAHYM